MTELSMTELNPQLLMYIATAAGLFAIGIYGFIVGPQTLRRILALNIIGAGIFMLMVALAYREPAETDSQAAVSPDPVLHALILTGLVVAVSATAFALALLARLKQASATQDALKQEPEP
ncbi:NADH-quinone oxidoreductase subunit K [Rheinheimera sp. NSM]|uniref:NADH-quinone oxidoreductase subunit K n=1 Tax=Rheinheimera sp. NSM TaxID=3457884 RepID=UPI004035CFA6